MSSEMETNQEKLAIVAMQIILHAGNARKLIMDGLDAIECNTFKEAEEFFIEAKKELNSAHRAQTDTIQAETRGEEQGYSLLFNHAQDTLMTIMSEYNVAQKILKIISTLDKRISKLELNIK